ncbi:MAG: 2-amino-4-hydroxy-6-hydroxymethyldihydropteridine diphosphokinase [Candidatus Hydrogenedentes bacterium]|nr:2-amino-4-hydroxy-6-hydroxymethyldihydropteridine diphosphokinase [Candidatus Hydrogenedentota bacterium]
MCPIHEARDTTAYIGVGSNIDAQQHVESGLLRLRDRVRIMALSTFYWSPALGHPEQPPYLNGVVRVETLLPARALKFDVLRSIEEAEERVRSDDRYAPRTLDMDIVIHGTACVEEPGLKLPDPAVLERGFLFLPLLEVAAAELCWPPTGQPLNELSAPRDVESLEADRVFTRRLQERILG